jgi:hypothetical protein
MSRIIAFPYIVPERFLPHIGDERKMIAKSPVQRGGSVSFAEHLGKPLTERLWEDLYERLLCVAINIYGPGFDEQKTIGHMWGPGVWILLDGNYLVKDIQYHL